VTVLLVAVGGAAGAVLRHLVDRLARARPLGALPWGILAVNLLGALVLGLLTGAAAAPPLAALLGTGFCGALTTYSTFAQQTVELTGNGRRRLAAGYALGSVAAGLALAAAGYELGKLVVPGA
jgi:fluoride exporter